MVHQDSTVFFRHSARPSWGLAIMTREMENKRRYQFEDGQLRTIAKGYYHLLKAAPPPKDADNKLAKLLLERDLGRSRRRLKRLAPEARKSIVTLREQIAWFQDHYPMGFKGEAWIKEHRGPEGKRALKRHRDPVLDKAQDVLSQEALAAVRTPEQGVEWFDRLKGLLRDTDLVKKKDLEALDRVPDVLTMVRGVESWLYGGGTFSDALRGFEPPTWSLVTTIGALARPEQHIAVTTSSFSRLAHFLKPSVGKIDARLDSKTYRAILSMCQIVRLQLTDSGESPTDLFDVRDFIIATLRPKVIKEIRQMSPAILAEETESAAA